MRGRVTEDAFRVLPALEVDYADGKILPEKLGRSEAPVTVLPSVVVDFEQSARPAARSGSCATDPDGWVNHRSRRTI